MAPKKILIAIQSILLAIFVPLLTIFGWGFIFFSNLPYNEEGRYLDEKTDLVLDEDYKLSFGFITLLLIIVVALLVKWMLTTIKSR